MKAEDYLSSIEGQKLLGHVVTFGVKGKVPYADVRKGLGKSGLDEEIAKEMLPRNAFVRACKELAEARIIRPLKEREDKNYMHFQFTAERLRVATEGSHYQYDFEAILTLDKHTGNVTCDTTPVLAKLAEEELEKTLKVRTATDISNMTKRLFKSNADLFPISPHGFAYFVPVEHSKFLAQIQVFLEFCGGHLRTFPIAAGSAAGKASVKDAVSVGILRVAEEYISAINSFGDSTRDDTIERAAEKIKTARFKVEAYAAYLEENKDMLLSKLHEANVLLMKKIDEKSKSKDKDTDKDVKNEPATESTAEVKEEKPPTFVWGKDDPDEVGDQLEDEAPATPAPATEPTPAVVG